MALGKWGDGGTWGHAAPNNFWNDATQEFSRREALFDIGKMHRVSVKFTYINATDISPRVSNVSVLLKSQKGQQLFTHEALFDRQIGIISLSIQHGGGTDFVISNVQLLAQQEKQRPRG